MNGEKKMNDGNVVELEWEREWYWNLNFEMRRKWYEKWEEEWKSMTCANWNKRDINGGIILSFK